MGKDEFNPYAPPTSGAIGIEHHLDEPDLAWRDRKILVVRKGAELPDLCIKCNAPAEGFRFSRTLSWLKSIYIVVFLISPILYVLVYFLVRWKGKVTVGLCPRHRRRRTRAIALGWLTALAGFGTLFITGIVSSNYQGAVILTGVVLLLGGVIGGAFGSRVLTPTKIDKNFIWLTNVSPNYLAEFRAWNA